MPDFRRSGFSHGSGGQVGVGQRGSGSGGAGYPGTPTTPASGSYAQPNAPQNIAPGTVAPQTTFTIIRSPQAETYQQQAMQSRTAGRQQEAEMFERKALEEMKRKTTFVNREAQMMAEREQILARPSAQGQFAPGQASRQPANILMTAAERRAIPFQTVNGITQTRLPEQQRYPVIALSEKAAAKVAGQGGGVTTYQQAITPQGRPHLGMVRTFSTPQMSAEQESLLLTKVKSRYSERNISKEYSQPRQNVISAERTRQQIIGYEAQKEPPKEGAAPIKELNPSQLVSPEDYNAQLLKNVAVGQIGQVSVAPKKFEPLKDVAPTFTGAGQVTEAARPKDMWDAGSRAIDKANQQGNKVSEVALKGWRVLAGGGEAILSGLWSGFRHPVKTVSGMAETVGTTVTHPVKAVEKVSEALQKDPERVAGNIAGSVVLGEMIGAGVSKIPIGKGTVQTGVKTSRTVETARTEVASVRVGRGVSEVRTTGMPPTPGMPNVVVNQATDVLAKTRTTLPSGKTLEGTSVLKVLQKADGYANDQMAMLKGQVRAQGITPKTPLAKVGQQAIKIATGEKGKVVFSEDVIRSPTKNPNIFRQTRTKSYAEIRNVMYNTGEEAQRMVRVSSQESPTKVSKYRPYHTIPEGKAAVSGPTKPFTGATFSQATELARIEHLPAKQVVKAVDVTTPKVTNAITGEPVIKGTVTVPTKSFAGGIKTINEVTSLDLSKTPPKRLFQPGEGNLIGLDPAFEKLPESKPPPNAPKHKNILGDQQENIIGKEASDMLIGKTTGGGSQSPTSGLLKADEQASKQLNNILDVNKDVTNAMRLSDESAKAIADRVLGKTTKTTKTTRTPVYETHNIMLGDKLAGLPELGAALGFTQATSQQKALSQAPFQNQVNHQMPRVMQDLGQKPEVRNVQVPPIPIIKTGQPTKQVPQFRIGQGQATQQTTQQIIQQITQGTHTPPPPPKLIENPPFGTLGSHAGGFNKQNYDRLLNKYAGERVYKGLSAKQFSRVLSFNSKIPRLKNYGGIKLFRR